MSWSVPPKDAVLGRSASSGLIARKNPKSSARVRFLLLLSLLPFLFPSAARGDQLQDANAAFNRRDYESARRIAESLAATGNVKAEEFLGFVYLTGLNDPQQAMIWLHKASDAGSAHAAYQIGHMYMSGMGVARDISEAVKWLGLAANRGDFPAANDLGFLYSHGNPQLVKDPVEAMKWYRKAADQGDYVAEYNVGLMYEEGEGVKQDGAEAMKWYLKSENQDVANQGNADAELHICNLYGEGLGVAKDFIQAAKWCLKSAEHGNSQAQQGMGTLYLSGAGVKQDYAEAYFWYSLAGGKYAYPGGADAFGNKYLKPEEIDAVKNRVREWKQSREQAQTPAPPVRTIEIGDIEYKSDTDWTVWLNGKAVTPSTLPQGVKTITVKPNRVPFTSRAATQQYFKHHSAGACDIRCRKGYSDSHSCHNADTQTAIRRRSCPPAEAAGQPRRRRPRPLRRGSS
jgi:TPR repeat protein